MTETIAVQRDEYVFGRENGQLAFSDDHLVHVGRDEDGEDADRIPLSDVSDVETTVDKSATGFRTIGIVLGLVALLFTGVTVQMVLAGSGINLISAGTTLSAGFGWLGAVQYYRADRGALTVLAIRTDDDEFVFYTQRDDDAVDAIVERLRNTESGHVPGAHRTAS